MRLLLRFSLVLSGILLPLLFLELTLRLGGWGYGVIQEWSNRRASAGKNSYRILCLGESTTAPTLPPDRSYPAQLQEVLNERGGELRFDVINQGAVGATTIRILSRLEANIEKFRPDIVVTMMGINDGERYIFRENGGKRWPAGLRAYKLFKLLLASLPSGNTRRAAPAREKSSRFSAGGHNPSQPAGEESGRSLIEQAIEKRKQGDLAGAEALLRRSLRQSPGGDRAAYELALVCRESGKHEEAETLFKKLLAKHPDDAQTSLELARVYLGTEKYGQAEALLRRLLRGNPSFEAAAIELARACRGQDRHAEAGLLLAKLLRRNPANDVAALELAVSLRGECRYGEAEAILKRILKSDPAHAQAAIELALCLRRRKNYGEAQTLLNRVLQENPENAQAAAELAVCYREDLRFGEAEAILRRILRRNPADEQALVELAACRRMDGDQVQAETLLRKALKRNPAGTQVVIGLSQGYRSQKRLPEALTLLRGALQERPSDRAILIELADCYQEGGQYAAAENLLRKAMEKSSYDREETARIESRLLEIRLLSGHAAPPSGGSGPKINPAGGLEQRSQRTFALADYLNPEGQGSTDLSLRADEGLDYPTVTKENYLGLSRVLREHGILHICVQYPMRDPAPLRALFDGAADIAFVDNSKSFKEAVRREGLRKYFTDLFGGDFGHCTAEGNRLIAENVAEAILARLGRPRR